MPTFIPETTILVPVDVSDPGRPSASLVELLSPHSVVVLGYYPVPDQSATDQVRSQFGEEAAAELDGVADRFADAGAAVESVLVFTKDHSETIGRVAAEHEADAVLESDATSSAESVVPPDRILVSLRGDDNLDEILAFLRALLSERDAAVTFLNVTSAVEAEERGEALVRNARDRLLEGLGDRPDPDLIECRQERDRAPAETIVDAADAFDLLVFGESEPSLRERLFGSVTNKVTEASPKPVLIVRNSHED